MMDMLHILMPYGDQRSLLLFFYYVFFLNLLRLRSYLSKNKRNSLIE